MNSLNNLFISKFLIKRSFDYRPFNYKDSVPGGLAAAALGGLGGAAIGKIRDYFSSDEEKLDPNSDEYGVDMLSRARGKRQPIKKPSSVGSSALLGALTLGLPVALAPALFGDNPIGRNLIKKLEERYINKKDSPEFIKNLERAAHNKLPHSWKQRAIENLTFQL